MSFRGHRSVSYHDLSALEALANLELIAENAAADATLHEQPPLGSQRWVEPPWSGDASGNFQAPFFECNFLS
jgi:hypothetical protein